MYDIKIQMCALIGMLSLAAVPVWADELCPDQAPKAAAQAQLAQAQALESAGKLHEAYAAISKISLDCAPPNTDGLKRKIALSIGAEAEQKGKLDEAVDWYERAGDKAAGGRVISKIVSGKPADIKSVSRAIDFYRAHDDKAQEQAMRNLALKNVDTALAAEAKNFATPSKGSLGDLRLAQEWTFYAQAGKDRVRTRATERGDSLGKEDSRTSLKKAMDYYSVADVKEGIARIKAKAAGLGKQAEAKSELEVAADYYSIADEGAKSNAVSKQAEATKQKAEEGRKKTFTKDQADLEKELGF
ncbi:MAG: hypothetical protein HP491_16295 [Nitrospira sp.]|nr:hypothetical protein [Nitrospira sp.]MBH0182701.1 hypothetical protein [Nitrospira sp.]MBH0184813.1 hypothetical protein [Nitrospira sp.]